MAIISLQVSLPNPHIAPTPENSAAQQTVSKIQPFPCTQAGKATECPKSPGRRKETPNSVSTLAFSQALVAVA